MKPPGRIERRTRLQRKAPMVRTEQGIQRMRVKSQLPQGTPRPAPKRPKVSTDFPVDVKQQAGNRAGGKCEGCGRQFGATVTVGGDVRWLFDAHHRRRRGVGPNTVENCAALCRECHEWAHNHPAEASARGLIVPTAVADCAPICDFAVILHDGRTVRFTCDGGYDVAWDDAEGEVVA